MSTTPKSGWRYPASSAAPNVPLDLQNLATDLDWLGANYANTSARNTANPTPATGDECHVAGIPQVYYGSAWHVVQDDSSWAWTSVTMSSGWSTVASGVQTFRYRRYAGQIQFDGFGFYTGTIGTTHVQLTAAITAVANALPANSSTYSRLAVYNSVSMTTPMYLEPSPDGRMWVVAAANVINPVVNFSGLSIADISVG